MQTAFACGLCLYDPSQQLARVIPQLEAGSCTSSGGSPCHHRSHHLCAGTTLVPSYTTSQKRFVVNQIPSLRCRRHLRCRKLTDGITRDTFRGNPATGTLSRVELKLCGPGHISFCSFWRSTCCPVHMGWYVDYASMVAVRRNYQDGSALARSTILVSEEVA